MTILPAIKYVLEIHNSAGDLISILEKAYDRSHSQRVNEPDGLSFSLPADDDKGADLVLPNEIWLRNYETGVIRRKFILTHSGKIDDGMPHKTIEGKSYLSKLLLAVVVSYVPTNLTPTQIITALLGYQTLMPVITVGTIEPTGTYSFSWTNTTVLKCLNDLIEVIGGYIDVTDANVFNWLNDIGTDTGQQIRYRKNLIGVSEDKDWQGVATRLYPTCSEAILSNYVPIWDPVDNANDATYGYLLLQNYKCYGSWTGAGNALPTGTKIYRTIAEASSVFTSVSGTNWANVARAIDGNTATYANHYTNSASWTNYVVALKTTPVLCTGMRWFMFDDNHNILRLNIDVTINGTTWETIIVGTTNNWNSAWWYAWGQYDFAEPRSVMGMRVRVLISGAGAEYVYCNELELRTTQTDETALYVQGANERTYRCAIANFHSGDIYHAGYTHATFLKDFVSAATYGDIGKLATFNYANDAYTLLVWGQAQMTSLSTSPTSYSSDVLFLNEIDINFSIDAPVLGNIVNLIHEILGIEDSVRLVGIIQNLDNPAEGSIEIVTKTPSLTEAFRALWNKV